MSFSSRAQLAPLLGQLRLAQTLMMFPLSKISVLVHAECWYRPVSTTGLPTAREAWRVSRRDSGFSIVKRWGKTPVGDSLPHLTTNREKTGFHSFRRFRVTHLRKQGTPEDLLRFWIGHGDKTVTDRYAKLSEDVAFRKTQAERVGIGFNLEVVPCCPRTFNEEQPSQVVVM